MRSKKRKERKRGTSIIGLIFCEVIEAGSGTSLFTALADFNPDSLNTPKHHPFQGQMGAINANARIASVNQGSPRYTRIYSH